MTPALELGWESCGLPVSKASWLSVERWKLPENPLERWLELHRAHNPSVPVPHGIHYQPENSCNLKSINMAESEPAAGREAESDIDSAYEVGSNRSSTNTLHSYLLRDIEENHAQKSGEYLFPNDDKEQERLYLQHHLLGMAVGKLHTCQLDENHLNRVLDIGTGTGMWAIEFADEYPQAQVVGVDLSPIQPVWVPTNLSFYVNDAEDSWTFSYDFDFIYCRTMAGAIRDWPKLYQQSFGYGFKFSLNYFGHFCLLH